jgi:hypothetical protein
MFLLRLWMIAASLDTLRAEAPASSTLEPAVSSKLREVLTCELLDAQPAVSATPESTPHSIFIFAGNWTRAESSGTDCLIAWGGLGASPTGGRLRGWALPVRGDDAFWAETFRYTTYKSESNLDNGAVSEWTGVADPQAAANFSISSTYRVSYRSCRQVRCRVTMAVLRISVGKAGRGCVR